MTQPVSVTAAVLVIGDEILSGRTQDKNTGYIADYLTKIGIELREIRVVGDVEAEIVAAVNALRVRYNYLFTTGALAQRTTTSPPTRSPPPSAFQFPRIRARSNCCWSESSSRISMRRADAWRGSRMAQS